VDRPLTLSLLVAVFSLCVVLVNGWLDYREVVCKGRR
jgi:hypothetical protein